MHTISENQLFNLHRRAVLWRSSSLVFLFCVYFIPLLSPSPFVSSHPGSTLTCPVTPSSPSSLWSFLLSPSSSVSSHPGFTSSCSLTPSSLRSFLFSFPCPSISSPPAAALMGCISFLGLVAEHNGKGLHKKYSTVWNDFLHTVMVFHFSVGWHCPCPVLKVIMSHFRLLLFPSLWTTISLLPVSRKCFVTCVWPISPFWIAVLMSVTQNHSDDVMSISTTASTSTPATLLQQHEHLYECISEPVSITLLTYKWFAWCYLLTYLGQCLIRLMAKMSFTATQW